MAQAAPGDDGARAQPGAAPQDEAAGLRPALEAVLMVADEPVAPAALARATGSEETTVLAVLRELAGEYSDAGRGFELREVAGGWRMFSRAEHAGVVEAFLLDGQTAKLTQAALETLAIVAYRQPVSRARVSAVRGVSVDGVMRTLLTRGLVCEAGVEATSGATLYRTTDEFLHRMGLRSLEELPPLAPFLPELTEVDAVLQELEAPEVLAGAEPPAAGTAQEHGPQAGDDPGADDDEQLTTGPDAGPADEEDR
ncbi:hypothetical protein NUM3379_00180 [Kineococcus sp. NUM-3379]